MRVSKVSGKSEADSETARSVSVSSLMRSLHRKAGVRIYSTGFFPSLVQLTARAVRPPRDFSRRPAGRSPSFSPLTASGRPSPPEGVPSVVRSPDGVSRRAPVPAAAGGPEPGSPASRPLTASGRRAPFPRPTSSARRRLFHGGRAAFPGPGIVSGITSNYTGPRIRTRRACTGIRRTSGSRRRTCPRRPDRWR